MSPLRATSIISDLDQVSHPIFSKWNDSAQIGQNCNDGKDRYQSTCDHAEIRTYKKRKTTEQNEFAPARSFRGNSNAKGVIDHYFNEREMIMMKTQHLVEEYRGTLLKTGSNPESPADSTSAVRL